MYRRLPTLSELGVATMLPAEMALLALELRRMAADLDDIRFLSLERLHRRIDGIPNRPTIGYYLQLRMAAGLPARLPAQLPAAPAPVVEEVAELAPTGDLAAAHAES